MVAFARERGQIICGKKPHARASSFDSVVHYIWNREYSCDSAAAKRDTRGRDVYCAGVASRNNASEIKSALNGVPCSYHLYNNLEQGCPNPGPRVKSDPRRYSDLPAAHRGSSTEARLAARFQQARCYRRNNKRAQRNATTTRTNRVKKKQKKTREKTVYCKLCPRNIIHWTAS